MFAVTWYNKLTLKQMNGLHKPCILYRQCYLKTRNLLLKLVLCVTDLKYIQIKIWILIFLFLMFYLFIFSFSNICIKLQNQPFVLLCLNIKNQTGRQLPPYGCSFQHFSLSIKQEACNGKICIIFFLAWHACFSILVKSSLPSVNIQV